MTRHETDAGRRLGQLAAAVPGAVVIGAADTPIGEITYDSRTAGPGMLFAALVGGDFDGHDYVASAVAAGAAAVLVEREMPVAVPQIVAPDTARAALAPLSRAFFGDPSRELMVVGITGTDGKTTTTAMVEGILAGTGHQVGTIGTVGIRIGDGTALDLGHQTTPESVTVQRVLRRMVDAGTRFAVLEATSHGLSTHRLDGVRFLAGGVTNITREHLEFHKTIENYRRAKAILLERVAAEQGVVVLNIDDEGARAVAPFANGANLVTFSATGGDATLRAERISHEGTGVSFDIVVDDTRTRVALPMPGAFNVANALLAIGLTTRLGVPLTDAARALSDATPVRGRMQPVDAGQPFRVIVDYAHTPESIRTILTMLRHQYAESRLIVVTGSAGERDTTKRPLQGAACAELADLTVVTSEDPRHENPEAINAEIVAGAVAAGAVPGVSVLSIVDRRDAIREAFARANPGDCVLLAGKGHETSIIWGYEHMPWDEAAVAEELLREMFAP